MAISSVDIFYYPITDELESSERFVTHKQLAENLLDENESARLSRFKNESARDRFLIARLVAKAELAKQLECEAKEVGFSYSDNRKPYLQNHSIHFSISHCDTAVVVAISKENIGVDVEPIFRKSEPWKKASMFFNEQAVQQIQLAVEPREIAERFGIFWSSMEAVVKHQDTSVFSERARFSTDLHAENRVYAHEIGDVLTLRSLILTNNDVISCAFSNESAPINLYLWSHEIEQKSAQKLIKKMV